MTMSRFGLGLVLVSSLYRFLSTSDKKKQELFSYLNSESDDFLTTVLIGFSGVMSNSANVPRSKFSRSTKSYNNVKL